MVSFNETINRGERMADFFNHHIDTIPTSDSTRTLYTFRREKIMQNIRAD